jgi:hypothetical protein
VLIGPDSPPALSALRPGCCLVFAEEPLTATPPLQTYGKCFESVESYSGAESKPAEAEPQEPSAEAMDSAKAETRMNMAKPSAARPLAATPAAGLGAAMAARRWRA